MPSLQASLWIWEWREWQYLLAWFSLLQYYVSNIVLTERCTMTEAAQNGYCISLFHGFVSAVLPTSWNVTCRYGVPPRTETYGFNQLQLVWQWLWAVSSKQPSKATGHPKRTEMMVKIFMECLRMQFSSWVNWSQGRNFFDLLLLSLGGSRAAWMLSLTTKSQNKDRCPWAWRSIGAVSN